MTGEGAVPRRAIAARLAAAAAAVVVLLLLAAGVLYLERLEVARRLALAWMGDLGVQGEVRLRSLGPTGLKARVRIGPQDHPDLTVEDADVSYSLDSFLRGKGLQVSAVRLTRPVLRASFRNGRLDLGSLDRLSAALKPKPGVPPTAPPRIEVRSGRLRLDTDYGPAVLTGDADVDQGRVDRLDLALAPTTLRLGQASAVLQGGTVKAARSGDRLRLGAQVQAASVRLDPGSATGAEFDLRADLSYAALAARRIEGRVDGQGTIREASADGLTAAGLKLDLQSPNMTAALDSRSGSGRFHLRAGAAELRQAGVRLDHLAAEGSGALSLDRGGAKADFTGGISGAGASTALGPPAKDDAPVFAAVKRSLQGFRFAVDRGELSLDHGRLSGRLLAPARARSASGGALDLKPSGAGYVVTLAGGGLPEARADIGPLVFTGGAVSAPTRLSAAFSLGLLDGARVAADGRLSLKDGAVAFAARSCADVAVKRLDFGDNSAEDFAARLCPAREPLLAVSAGGWSLAGEARDASARAPAFQVRLNQGAGSMRLHGRGKDMGAEFVVDRVEVTDLAKPLRFHPVTASGRAALAKDVFSGAVEVATPKGVALAHADFRDQVTAMTGGMAIHVPALTFAKGGLQPSQLSPLTAALGEPASGKVSFDGRFDWAGARTTSSGRLTADGLSFRSPAGAVTGFSGAMAFTSLAPLKGASVGPLTAERVTGVVPLTEVSAMARVDDQTATVTDGVASVGGGHVRLNAVASLAADQTVTGQVTMDKVQVRDLVAGSPFSDKVSMTAEISGRLPFRMSGGKLRITDGSARADGPGRLSINRATFNPGGSKTGPATEDNLSTFGYQAMEYLAFQSLDATIGSQPDGKLRMVFHVVGKHDPPTKKELRLTWRDFFDRKILNKSMPLPSNTGVNLTLDTTLNLDNLIQSQGALDRQLGSATVQSPGVTIGADTSERGQ